MTPQRKQMPRYLTDVEQIEREIKKGIVIHRIRTGMSEVVRIARDDIDVKTALSFGDKFELNPGSVLSSGSK